MTLPSNDEEKDVQDAKYPSEKAIQDFSDEVDKQYKEQKAEKEARAEQIEQVRQVKIEQNRKRFNAIFPKNDSQSRLMLKQELNGQKTKDLPSFLLDIGKKNQEESGIKESINTNQIIPSSNTRSIVAAGIHSNHHSSEHDGVQNS